MTKDSFRVVYDSDCDVLYVSQDGGASAVAPEGGAAPSRPHRVSGDGLVGVRIAEFNAYWGGRFDALPSNVKPRSRVVRSVAAR